MISSSSSFLTIVCMVFLLFICLILIYPIYFTKKLDTLFDYIDSKQSSEHFGNPEKRKSFCQHEIY